MQHRTKRLIGFAFKNMAVYIGYILAFLLAASAIALAARTATVFWGPRAGLGTLGFILGMIGLGGVALMKAYEDLKLTELREQKVMDKLRDSDGDSYFPKRR